MKTYDVKIRAIVEKTIRVEADDERAAVERAHQEFTVSAETEENYDEDTIWVHEVKG